MCDMWKLTVFYQVEKYDKIVYESENHALKQINAKNCEEKGIKHNRKMLKLSHLWGD